MKVFFPTCLLGIALITYTGEGAEITCPMGQYNKYLENRVSGTHRRRRRRISVICVPCAKGRFQDALEHGFFSCNACPAGQYQPLEGKGFCLGTICPVGKYGPIAQIEPSKATCTECSVGKYNNVAGFGPECVECESGRYQADTGASTCQGELCFPGKYGPSGSIHHTAATCTDCNVGHYSLDVGEQVCKECSSGMYQVLPGQTSCAKKPMCGMAQFFDTTVYSCRYTNEAFKFIVPMGIVFTIVFFMSLCCKFYLINAIHWIITMALTIRYGMKNYLGEQSDVTAYCVLGYMCTAFVWMLLMFSCKRDSSSDDNWWMCPCSITSLKNKIAIGQQGDRTACV